MKETKKEGCQIMGFYIGGVKFHASVTHTKEELELMIGEAVAQEEPILKLNTVNEDPSIKDDCLIMTFDKLLFCSIIVRDDSTLIVPRNSKVIQ